MMNGSRNDLYCLYPAFPRIFYFNRVIEVNNHDDKLIKIAFDERETELILKWIH